MATETQVKAARKQHQCSFCAAPILKGEPYVHVRVTPWDHPDNDTFFTWRGHPYCDRLWHSVVGPDHDWEWDEFYGAEFREYGDDDAPWLATPTTEESDAR